MADAILGPGKHARKSQTPAIPTSDLPDNWFDLPGLVKDPLVDAETQVRVLDRVDETGCASLGELVASLPGHAKPVHAVLRLAELGILAVEPGLIDGETLMYRYRNRSRISDKDEGGAGGAPADPGNGKLHHLNVNRPQPDIFFTSWSNRRAFRQEPALRRRGFYLSLYCGSAYSGWSSYLADRLVDSNHLLEYGVPDLVIAVVDRNNILTEAQMRVCERLLARAVEKDPVLKRANRSLPAGGFVKPAEFAQADRFVRDFVNAVRGAGLAFIGQAPSQPVVAAEPAPEHQPQPMDAPEAVQHFSMHACGVHATARVGKGAWTLQTGSQIRSNVLASAGSGVLQQRQELLHNGGLVANGDHLLLTKDVPFETASSAARFVSGSGHGARVWHEIPKPDETSWLHL